MQLLQSWKESLSIFKPANFKLFVLITIKSVWETYKILFKYFWWLIILLVTVQFYKTALGMLILFGVPLLLVYLILLIARPSVGLKNWAYFGNYILYIIPFLIMVAILFSYYEGVYFNRPSGLTPFVSLSQIITFVFPVQFQSILQRDYRLNFLTFFMFLQVLLSPFIILFNLFYLDSDKSFRSIIFSFIRSLKMVLYNYPAFLIMWTVFLSLWYLLMSILFKYFTYNVVFTIQLITFVFLVPLLICIFTNLYIKQVHEYFDLYFGKGPSEQEGA